MEKDKSRNVLIAGGSGLIGSELSQYLVANGYKVRILSRSSNRSSSKEGISYVHWKPTERFIDPKGLENLFAVINLSGKNIIKDRWTDKVKQELRNSRIASTGFLVQALMEAGSRPEHFIQASAMGYFGHREDELLTESSNAGEGFMAELCKDWENAAQPIESISRLSVLRIALYLHPKGGFYKILKSLSPLYLAVAFGSGNQYVNITSYHLFNRLVCSILDADIAPGLYHAVGDKALTLNHLIAEIASVNRGKKILPNIPAFLLRWVLGESSTTLLNSTRIESEKLASMDFYDHMELPKVLKAL